MSVTLELQKSILDALTAALAGMSPAVTVTQDAAREQSLPYVALDRIIGRASDTLARAYTTHAVYLSVWSRYEGTKEVLDIIGRASDDGVGGSGIKGALHNARLVLAAGKCISCRVISDEVSRDADDLTYLGSVTLRVITQDT